jgi:hypothetical protein
MIAPWCSTRKSHLVLVIRVGELPEAANESCEDIDPPKKDARESLVRETLRWVFAPVAVSSFEGAPWLSLGCWTAEIAATLDIVIRIRQSELKQIVLQYLRTAMTHSWGQR